MNEFHSALLVLGGDLNIEEPFLRELFGGERLVIAADGGFRHAQQLGLPVDVVIGDFDSIDPQHLMVVAESRTRVIPISDQYSTDFEKALTWLNDEGIEDISIIGFEGGRSDHAFVNFSVVRSFVERFRSIIIHDGENEMHVLLPRKEPHELTLAGGTRISLLPFPFAAMITTTGLRWPITNGDLEFGARVGLSNRVTDEGEVSIRFESGALLIAIERTRSSVG